MMSLAHDWLGDSLSLRGLSEEALLEYQRGIELDPSQEVWPYLHLAEYAMTHGDIAGGERWYRAAYEQFPTYPYVLRGLGWVELTRGNFQAAIDWYQQAVDDGLPESSAASALAQAYLNLCQLNEAKRYAQMAVQNNPGDVWSLAIRGDVMAALGRKGQALEDYIQLAKHQPEFIIYLDQLERTGWPGRFPQPVGCIR